MIIFLLKLDQRITENVELQLLSIFLIISNVLGCLVNSLGNLQLKIVKKFDMCATISEFPWTFFQKQQKSFHQGKQDAYHLAQIFQYIKYVSQSMQF